MTPKAPQEDFSDADIEISDPKRYAAGIGGVGLGVELLPGWQGHLPPAVRRFDLTRPSPALRLFSESARLRQRLENGRVRLLRRLRG